MDTEDLKKLFHYCNDKYFDGKLPEPKFRVSHSRTQLGTFSYTRYKNSNSLSYKKRDSKGVLHLPSFGGVGGGLIVGGPIISISDYYLMTADQLEDVMTHEMIHYSIAYTGLKDSAPHGVIFRGMMDAINRKWGRHISVMTYTKGWKPRVAPKPQTYLVLGLQMRDGTFFLSSVNPKFAGDLELRLRRVREVVSHKWIRTTDDYFRTFPKVRSLRGRRVTEAVYKSKMGE